MACNWLPPFALLAMMVTLAATAVPANEPVKRQVMVPAGAVDQFGNPIGAVPAYGAAPVDAYGNPVAVQQPQYYPPPQPQVIVQEKPKEEAGGFFNYAYKAFFAGGR